MVRCPQGSFLEVTCEKRLETDPWWLRNHEYNEHDSSLCISDRGGGFVKGGSRTARRDRVRAAAAAANVRLVEILTSESIGGLCGGREGVFDASPETARHLIELGRSDVRKKL